MDNKSIIDNFKIQIFNQRYFKLTNKNIFKVFVNQDVLESKISSFVPNVSNANVGNMVSGQAPTPNEYMQWVLENGNMDYNKPAKECDNNSVKWHTLETCN